MRRIDSSGTEVARLHNLMRQRAQKSRLKSGSGKEIPIRKIAEPEQRPFIDLVDQILLKKQSKRDSDTSGLELGIDQLVYRLYDLTPDEIALIEPSVGPGRAP